MSNPHASVARSWQTKLPQEAGKTGKAFKADLSSFLSMKPFYFLHFESGLPAKKLGGLPVYQTVQASFYTTSMQSFLTIPLTNLRSKASLTL